VREQTLAAHPAPATGDVERHDHPVTGFDVGDLGTHLHHDAHRFVAEDIAGGEVGTEDLIDVQVRGADRGRGDLDDRVGRFLDTRIWNLDHRDVPLALPGKCSHPP
jgi:hypothetical protein